MTSRHADPEEWCNNALPWANEQLGIIMDCLKAGESLMDAIEGWMLLWPCEYGDKELDREIDEEIAALYRALCEEHAHCGFCNKLPKLRLIITTLEKLELVEDWYQHSYGYDANSGALCYDDSGPFTTRDGWYWETVEEKTKKWPGEGGTSSGGGGGPPGSGPTTPATPTGSPGGGGGHTGSSAPRTASDRGGMSEPVAGADSSGQSAVAAGSSVGGGASAPGAAGRLLELPRVQGAGQTGVQKQDKDKQGKKKTGKNGKQDKEPQELPYVIVRLADGRIQVWFQGTFRVTTKGGTTRTKGDKPQNVTAWVNVTRHVNEPGATWDRDGNVTKSGYVDRKGPDGATHRTYYVTAQDLTWSFNHGWGQTEPPVPLETLVDKMLGVWDSIDARTKVVLLAALHVWGTAASMVGAAGIAKMIAKQGVKGLVKWLVEETVDRAVAETVFNVLIGADPSAVRQALDRVVKHGANWESKSLKGTLKQLVGTSPNWADSADGTKRAFWSPDRRRRGGRRLVVLVDRVGHYFRVYELTPRQWTRFMSNVRGALLGETGPLVRHNHATPVDANGKRVIPPTHDEARQRLGRKRKDSYISRRTHFAIEEVWGKTATMRKRIARLAAETRRQSRLRLKALSDRLRRLRLMRR